MTGRDCVSQLDFIEQQKNICSIWLESVPVGTRQGLVECRHEKMCEHASTARGNFSELWKLINKFLMHKF